MSNGGAGKEGERESQAGSALGTSAEAPHSEPDAGLELTNHEIMT